MNNQSLIQAVRREAESCQKAFTEPHQNPEYRTSFHAMQIMLESLAAKLRDEGDQEVLERAGARRIEMMSTPELAPTLRDQFAMAALSACSSEHNPYDAAALAYKYADAMLARRTEK